MQSVMYSTKHLGTSWIPLKNLWMPTDSTPSQRMFNICATTFSCLHDNKLMICYITASHKAKYKKTMCSIFNIYFSNSSFTEKNILKWYGFWNISITLYTKIQKDIYIKKNIQVERNWYKTRDFTSWKYFLSKIVDPQLRNLLNRVKCHKCLE